MGIRIDNDYIYHVCNESKFSKDIYIYTYSLCHSLVKMLSIQMAAESMHHHLLMNPTVSVHPEQLRT